jgi:hypothetical protein
MTWVRCFGALGLVVISLTTVLSPTANAHANSVSYAEFSIDRGGVHGRVRLPLDDVDLLLRLDRDLDGRVSVAELDASGASVRAYLAKHMRVVADGAPIVESAAQLTVWRDPSAFQYLQADLSFPTARPPSDVSIHTDFLVELYPSHKTLGRISAAGRDEPFTFEAASTYRRSLEFARSTTIATVLVALTVLGLLAIARLRTPAVAVALAIVLTAAAARADVIMSAAGLNAALKTMEKLKRQTTAEGEAERVEALFQLGAEADALAAIMNLEVESHGMQERELLDLALSRTKALDVAIAYNRDKKKFFYDGAAFATYLGEAPRGAHAAAAEFKLLSYRFYQSPANDIASLTEAADAKQRFLARHPTFEANPEVRLYLAVDYRDLSRRYLEARDEANAARSRRLARAECLRIQRQYPRSDQADAARQLLRSLDQPGR